MKKTVIIGATPNPTRYAFLAAERLTENGMEFVPVGIKKGMVLGKEIQNLKQKPLVEGVHTIALYINPTHQPEWYDYFLSLKPKRVIFNPGTENPELEKLLEANNIEALEACTLVLLASHQF
ncbi:MAG: CoA-binding protein [Bacteroidetes bacterium]|nr:CoA-binding protein [Bacteroidota bacterium]MBS1539232.1 CoA-binding protein [Bacteroidota bacterium]